MAFNAKASITDEAVGSRSSIVSIRGPVDVTTARELERRLRDLMLAGKSTIVTDISAAEKVSPSLLGALVRIQRSLSWRNGRLVLVCQTRIVQDQLAAVGLPDLFDLVEASQLSRLKTTQAKVREPSEPFARRKARPGSARIRRARQAPFASRPPSGAT